MFEARSVGYAVMRVFPSERIQLIKYKREAIKLIIKNEPLEKDQKTGVNQNAFMKMFEVKMKHRLIVKI